MNLDTIRPDTPLERLLGGRTGTTLARELDVTTAGELLNHFPRRYVEYGALSSFAELIEGEHVTFVARILSASERRMQKRRGFIVDIVVADEHGGHLRMAFFSGYKARKALQPGVTALFAGKVTTYAGELTLNNPEFEVQGAEDARALPQSDEAAMGEFRQPIPLYPATAGISSWKIKNCVEIVLGQTDFTHWSDAVPEGIAEVEGLPGLGEAYELVHRPPQPGAEQNGWSRFRLEEALVVQGLMARRRRSVAQVPALIAPRRSGGILETFDAQLPFELTVGQSTCGAVIAEDLAAQKPMNRLLQGEVGSGKTLVALRAMLQVVDAGAQAAMVAPTEVLAIQHERSLRRLMGAGDHERLAERVNITLLTGSMSTTARKKALLDIASGQAGIIVGTHAVLGEGVQFAQLALAVIDEQHRFGVEQRNALRARFRPTPHMLVMSATPIPRSVVMTVFGDLELTVLEGLPGGRTPITTYVVPMMRGPEWIHRVWARIAEEVRAGHQAYVVCPKISTREISAESMDKQLLDRFGMAKDQDAVRVHWTNAQGEPHWTAYTRADAEAHIMQDASVELMLHKLRQIPVLSGVCLAGVHGQMPSVELSTTMTDVENGAVDVLVSTTVIEVGVDVPNATLMVILDADAFGISTLHQLRGRIGRGATSNNQCLLVTRMPEHHPSVQRLQQVASTNDGMALARLDLARRREGDVLSGLQSGSRSSLRRLRVAEHEDLIVSAGEWIARLSESDPEWSAYPELRQAIDAFQTQHSAAGEFIDRA